jgi:hypothetical protein
MAAMEKARPPSSCRRTLVTHGAVLGMTGSGKTGLCMALVEEALRSRVPVLMLDVKGDLANLALAFAGLDRSAFLPWVDEAGARRAGKTPDVVAEEIAARWREGLAAWGLGAGEPLHVLSPLEAKSELWDTDEEAAREALSAALSLLLRMVDREADATRGREHVLLAHLAERRLRAGASAGLEELLVDLREPPIERVGALSVDEFLAPKERAELAQDLNALVASPTFATWRQGAPLDVGAWLAFDGPRTPATIVSVAHLADEERMLVLSLVLEQTLAWVRGLPGTTDLRALVLFDEVFGFLPPHPANPPTKRPLLSLLKQARAFGVGCVVATQNPIDLDYKALSNAGVWFIGRLQTDADRERVIEGMTGSDAASADPLDRDELGQIVKSLPPRTFFVRDVHAKTPSQLLATRWTLSWLRGPMTRQEIKRWSKANGPPATPSTPPSPPPLPLPSAPPTASPTPAARVASSAPPPAIAAPDGWRTLYPAPPMAPLDAWYYAPYAGLIAHAEIADARLGFRAPRRLAVIAPLLDGGLDLARASGFTPEDLRHAAVPGAKHGATTALKGARAVKAIEKALRERAAQMAVTEVHVCAVLELVSVQGETRDAFAARCAEAARARAEQVKAVTIAKHDPKIRKLAIQRDAARAAAARAHEGQPGVGAAIGALLGGARAIQRAESAARRAADKLEKHREKLADAEAALAEALARQNGEIAARQAELASVAGAITTRELAPKKDGLTVEGYALVWIAT